MKSSSTMKKETEICTASHLSVWAFPQFLLASSKLRKNHFLVRETVQMSFFSTRRQVIWQKRQVMCRAVKTLQKPVYQQRLTKKWSISATYPVVAHVYLCPVLTAFPAKVCHTKTRQLMWQKAKSLNLLLDWL